MTKPLEDTDLMPYGQYANEPMEKVPAGQTLPEHDESLSAV